jgi:radical SAM superfamily enzyme YgiQ (UPF0313 family)
MNILLVYPEFLVTFWSWKHLLRFVSKKTAFPPLGLLTVAGMLPRSCEKKLVDLNVQKLTDEDIKWADYVFVSAMITQNSSAKEVILRCKNFGVPVVLGGPILEAGCERFASVSHFLMGEVENTLPEFLEDLQTGRAKKIYLAPAKFFPALAASPIPLWELINPGDYASMLVQYGRGCPFKCTFCNIAAINGRNPRTKSSEQFLRELDAIYKTGFRGHIMLADDNFIGNKKEVKEMLPKLIEWQRDRGYPFGFTAEVDITLSDCTDLMDLMVSAGFSKVFLGLETPNKDSLIECGKLQNASRDMAACVKTIQNNGMIPMSGFIVGFDSDNPDIFADQMINFIQERGIIIAMVGVLQVLPKTLLYAKLQQEDRLLTQASGNNTDCYPNFVPKMPLETLVQGYKRIVEAIYSPKKYYERISVFLREYKAAKRVVKKGTAADIKTFIASMWRIGLFGGLKTSYYYWKTLFLALFKYPKAFPEAVAFQIFGFHFQRIARSIQKS